MRIKKLMVVGMIAIAMMLSAVCVSATQVHDNILLQPENFVLSGAWSAKKDGSQYANSFSGNYLQTAERGATAEAAVYVEQEGEYSVWALVLQFNNGVPAYATVSVDGEKDSALFGSGVPNGFMWSRTDKTYNLAPGAHTITVHAEQPTLSCAAVFVTTNQDFDLSVNPSYDSLKQYGDLEKPVLKGAITVTETETANCFSVQFPEAEDTTAMTFKYYLNDAPIDVDENGMYQAINLVPLKSHFFKMVTADKLNNMETTVYELKNYTHTMELISFTDGGAHKLANLSQLMEGQTSVILQLKVDRFGKGTKKPRLFAGIYNKDESKMVYSKSGQVSMLKDSVNMNWELELPQEVLSNPTNYIVKVMLHESASDITSLAKGIVISD